MRKLLVIAITAITFMFSSNAQAFEEYQAGIFCNDRHVAEELAKVYKKSGLQRLRVLLHIQYGRARLAAENGMVAFLTNANLCLPIAVRTTEIPRFRNGVASFTTMPPFPFRFGVRTIKIAAPQHQIAGTEALYVLEIRDLLSHEEPKEAASTQ